jgi:predicted hotdog family 3-hydroxylacyl-ACP dehydratase
MNVDSASIYDRDWIVARIPHQGSMCLLNAVRSWDATHARCAASSHRDLANPLRHRNRLGAACAIEYAAQAMAVHAALLNGSNSRPAVGYLTSARAVEMHVEQLDDMQDDLDIVVERLSATDTSVLYDFSVSAGEQLLARGRATVVLDAAALEVGVLAS